MTLLRTPPGVLVSYLAATLLLSWPLPLHLFTQLTGAPGGDTGVYVWNNWVFHHEVTVGGGSPYVTDRIFASDGGATLGLHNYTLFQNLLALPLIPLIGVVATFNVIYLLMAVLTAFTTWLLVRHVTGAVVESWLAGLFFAWSPWMIARGGGHFSLVAAAPIPLFVWLLLRIRERSRPRYAAALGATLWWAVSTDVYYAVYCCMLAAAFLAAQVLTVERVPAVSRRIRRVLDVSLAAAGLLVAAILVTGGWEVVLLGRPVRMHGLYTPVLLLTVLALTRAALPHRIRLTPVRTHDAIRVLTLGLMAVGVAALLMMPMLIAALPLLGGDSPTPPVYWRSSPQGADLLAFVLPSPLHPLAPEPLIRWFHRLPAGLIENVVTIPLTVIALLVLAWRAGWRPDRWWAGLTIGFALLSLGPFVHVAGVNSYVPAPWAVLRYVPVIALARAPQRFAVVMLLGLAVLVAAALWWLRRERPHQSRLLLIGAAAVLAFELLPVPRMLYPATVPDVHRAVGAAPGDRPMLEIPVGIRAGTLSVGNFTAQSQFFQTAHGRPLLGGYLSRVPPQQIARLQEDPVLGSLMQLSEGLPITADQEAALMAGASAFLARTDVEFVLLDHFEAPAPLTELVLRAFTLDHVAGDGRFDLYRTAPPP